VVLLATAFVTGAATVGVAADVDSGQGPTPQDQGSAPAAQPAAPPADTTPSETTPPPPAEQPQPKPDQPKPDQSTPQEPGPDQSQPDQPATGEPSPAPPQLEPLPDVAPAAAEPAPVAAPPAAEPPAPPALASITDPLAGLKAHHSESSEPVATKSQFPECKKVADPAACNRKFGELIDREQADCSSEAQVGIGTTPACRQAYRDFHTFQTCVDEPNYDACAAQLAANPCFKDASSGPCDSFLNLDRIEKCKNSSASPSFECQVVQAARELFCTIGGGLRTDNENNKPRPRCSAGGGSEEQNSPGSRALPGSNQLATAGLVDPGARGDVGLKEVASASSSTSKKPKTTELPRTGQDVWPLILIGLLLVGAGLVVRRRSAAPVR
jgi:LPXTG-motif cell wall-anchored protein